MLAAGVRNLKFRFLFEDEIKIGSWVGKLSLGDATAIQTARLCRAWTACKVYFQQMEQDRSKVAWADLDSLLEGALLAEVQAAVAGQCTSFRCCSVQGVSGVVQEDALCVQQLEGPVSDKAPAT